MEQFWENGNDIYLEHLQRSGGGFPRLWQPATTCPIVSQKCHTKPNYGLSIQAGVDQLGPDTDVKLPVTATSSTSSSTTSSLSLLFFLKLQQPIFSKQHGPD
jgi:hypothetical protein